MTTRNTDAERWYDAMYGTARSELVTALERASIHPNVVQNLTEATERGFDIDGDLSMTSLTPTQKREAKRLLQEYSAARSPQSTNSAAPETTLTEVDDTQMLAQLRRSLERFNGAAGAASARPRLDRLIGETIRQGKPWSEVAEAVNAECAYLDRLPRQTGSRR